MEHTYAHIQHTQTTHVCTGLHKHAQNMWAHRAHACKAYRHTWGTCRQAAQATLLPPHSYQVTCTILSAPLQHPPCRTRSGSVGFWSLSPPFPKYRRRLMVLPCQNSLSFLSLDNREGFGEQTLPGKGWGLPTGGNLRQAGARRAQRQRHSSLQSPTFTLLSTSMGQGKVCKGESARGPWVPAAGCSPQPVCRGSLRPGGPQAGEAGGGRGCGEPIGAGLRLPHHRARLPRLPHTATAHPSCSLWA